MENTTLTLLASDGPITISFSPGLTTEQYADLNQVVSAGLLPKAEFCEKFEALAKVWGIQFQALGCD